MKFLTKATLTAAAVLAWQSASLFAAPIVTTATFTNATGTAWNVGGNWSSNPDWPSGVGAGAIFTGPSAARTTSMLSAVTVGSIEIDNNTTFGSTLNNGTGGSLTFDAVGTGPATLTVNGTGPAGAGNLTLSTQFTVNDVLVATVNQMNQSSSAGALNITGGMVGPGGFTKAGSGLATFGTNSKTYTGATEINGGRMRISIAARPQSTSSFTVNTGGQVELITAGPYDFGPGSLYLNGNGGYLGNGGAIRPATGLAVSLSDPTVLQSDTVVHSQGAGSGSISFTNVVSGPGKLTAGAVPHNDNVGDIILGGSNTYSGGSVLNVGRLIAAVGSTNAFGTGDVSVERAGIVFGPATARLVILSGAADAIADTAKLTLAGGGTPGVADDGIAELGAGVVELVGRLTLNGVPQPIGTYGSTASAATHKSDEFFTGTGIVVVTQLIPEPASVLLLGIASCGFLLTRRGR